MIITYQSLFGALQVIKLIFCLTDQPPQLLKTGAYQLDRTNNILSKKIPIIIIVIIILAHALDFKGW